VIGQHTVIPAKAGIQLLIYALALALAVAFKSVPISVASQSGLCQDEMAMGERYIANAMHTDVHGRSLSAEHGMRSDKGHFSFDKRNCVFGRHVIYSAKGTHKAHQNGLEAKPALRGKPKANATGVCFFGYSSLHKQRLNRRERF
jgi:hypothetical protein